MFYPVVGEAEADEKTVVDLAKLLGDPLRPENSLLKRVACIAHRQELPLNWPKLGGGSKTAADRPANSGSGRLPAPLPKQGLVALWRFDECDADDKSGNGHADVLHGSLECMPGIRGKAFYFDGRSNWIKVEHSSTLDYRERLTVSAWIKYKSIAGGYGSEILWYGDFRPPTISIRFTAARRRLPVQH